MATRLGLTVDLQTEATYAVNFLDLVIRVIHKSKSVRDATLKKLRDMPDVASNKDSCP